VNYLVAMVILNLGLLWITIAAFYVRRALSNHGVTPNEPNDLRVQRVNRCQQCAYCDGPLESSIKACMGCGAANPYWTPTIAKRKGAQDDRGIAWGMITQVTKAIEEATLMPPIIFGGEDCDIDELRGDNNVYARVSRCRERVGPPPPPGPSSQIIR
jgi:hypothetical protein